MRILWSKVFSKGTKICLLELLNPDFSFFFFCVCVCVCVCVCEALDLNMKKSKWLEE